MSAKELFLKAYANEIYADKVLNAKSRIREEYGFNFIKPFKMKTYISQPNFVYVIIVKFVVFFWPIINFLFSTLQFLKSILMYMKALHRKEKFKNNVGLDYSGRMRQIIGDSNIEEFNNIDWFSLSFSKTKNNLSPYNILKLKDYFRSYYYSILSPFWLRPHCNFKYQYMLSYSSYNWFITYFSLRHQSFDKIVFVNHYDRWAVLFDNLHSENIILLQHGIISADFAPPTKLKNISELYAYNEEEKDKFLKLVIYNKKCIFKLLKREIKLTSIPAKVNTPQVLLISCLPLTFDDEKKLLINISSKVTIFIKAHPVFSTLPYYELKKQFDFNLIVEKDLFPDVDLVISYNSTLGYEYELAGKKVIYYEKLSLDQIKDQINEL